MKKVRKAVIPVAGMGTRFLPVTKSIPKEMLPIIDIPTIDMIVEEAVQSGIEEILFITSPYKKGIEDYFDRSYELESRLEKSGKLQQLEMVRKISDKVKIFTVRQGEPLGSGHAVLLAKSFVGEEPFAVLFGDDLIKGTTPALKELIDIHDKTGANVIGVQEVPHELTYKYGIIDFQDDTQDKIKSIIEKPTVEEAPSNYAGLGRYIVNPELFDCLETIKTGAGGEYQFVDGLKELMRTQDFYACKFTGTYFDIGNQLGYLKANIEYGLEREDIKKELLAYLKEKTDDQA